MTEKLPALEALHQFTVYEGDIEYDDEGNITNRVVWQSPKYRNLIVTSGKNLVLDRLFGLGGAPAATNMGVGTESLAPALTQTRLNPSGGGTVFIRSGSASRAGNIVTISAVFGTGEANFTWREAGLFNGTINGTSTMFNRVSPIGPVSKTSERSVIYTIEVTQT